MIKTLLRGLLQLIHPSLCIACRLYEPYKEHDFCLSCINNLPFVDSPEDSRAASIGKEFFPENISFFYSLFYFSKESLVAEMIHRIKYKGQYRLARTLGEILGKEILKHHSISGYSIIPIPIHPKRLAERGFNQAEEIAKGIADMTEVPMVSNLLIRTAYEGSQTAKDKFERSNLLLESFGINQDTPIPTKVLLVDDVVTTGSTISACSKLLQKQNVEELAIVSLAVSI